MVHFVQAQILRIGFDDNTALFHIEVDYRIIYLAVHFAQSWINLFQHSAIRSSAAYVHDLFFAEGIITGIFDDVDEGLFIFHGRGFQSLYQSVPVFTSKRYLIKIGRYFFICGEIGFQRFGTFLRKLFVEFQRAFGRSKSFDADAGDGEVPVILNLAEHRTYVHQFLVIIHKVGQYHRFAYREVQMGFVLFATLFYYFYRWLDVSYDR